MGSWQWEQIVQDRCPEAQIGIYSTVEYTIEYMYKIIARRSDFCTLNVVIFKSGQTTGSGYAEPWKSPLNSALTTWNTNTQ